jgi:hypothetical protein
LISGIGPDTGLHCRISFNVITNEWVASYIYKVPESCSLGMHIAHAQDIRPFLISGIRPDTVLHYRISGMPDTRCPAYVYLIQLFI